MRYAALVAALLSVSLALAQEAPMAIKDWPPRSYLLKSLTDGIEGILNSQDPQTGRFGSKPWICSDQNVLLPLAAAWAIEDPANPWYHSERVLTAIAKGGEALVDDQDPHGRWIFRKKDNSTWGQIHMPWTYSRWIRAYLLVKDTLPPESRAKWEKGLLLGFKGIRRYADGGVHNIPTHHAMALYIAGIVFGNEEWKQAAAAFLHKVVAQQDPGGFWSENFGPVVGYNEVYVDALGVYYNFSKDPEVLPALQRSAQFHAAILWPDGSSVACVDERQVYHAGVEIGNVGFSWTPEGRGFLLQQMGLYVRDHPAVGADYAASMLLYSGTGPAVMPPAAGDKARATVGNNGAVVVRDKPWQWAMSAYACPVPKNRWIQDRHNLVDVYRDGLGLVLGGGNTKMQPYWSTFTRGDCALLKHDGSENPDFTPQIDLLWVPAAAKIETVAGAETLALKTGESDCRVTVTPQQGGSLKLTYEAPADQRFEAHVPFMHRGLKLTTATGKTIRLADDEVVLPAAEIGAWFAYRGLRVTVPPGATLRWPMRQHNPYTKDGSAPLTNAKLVLCLPFDQGRTKQEVTLSLIPAEQFDGLVFEARDLPTEVVGDGYTKRLDDLGSQLLGARKAGAGLVFTLPEVKPGKYELLAEFVLASMYGLTRVSLDDKPVGEPFDAYYPAVDAEGERVSFGTVTLAKGPHRLKMETIDKNAKSTGYLVSVKKWLLRRIR
ncbi:hypothetical protein LLH23_07970 [bacterium]|nr:hypothetical protein [bacterium]